MSALIVSANHINSLITWAVAHKVRFNFKGNMHLIDANSAQRMAAELYSENVRSVNCRYNERTRRTGFVFEPVNIGFLSAAHIIMACECLEYQSCETSNWRSTLACAIVDAIRARAGYLLAQKTLNGAHVWSL